MINNVVLPVLGITVLVVMTLAFLKLFFVLSNLIRHWLERVI